MNFSESSFSLFFKTSTTKAIVFYIFLIIFGVLFMNFKPQTEINELDSLNRQANNDANDVKRINSRIIDIESRYTELSKEKEDIIKDRSKPDNQKAYSLYESKTKLLRIDDEQAILTIKKQILRNNKDAAEITYEKMSDLVAIKTNSYKSKSRQNIIIFFLAYATILVAILSISYFINNKKIIADNTESTLNNHDIDHNNMDYGNLHSFCILATGFLCLVFSATALVTGLQTPISSQINLVLRQEANVAMQGVSDSMIFGILGFLLIWISNPKVKSKVNTTK
jgi:hypothetical protein